MTSVKWEINEGKAGESAQSPSREPGVTACRPSGAPVPPGDQGMGERPNIRAHPLLVSLQSTCPGAPST